MKVERSPFMFLWILDAGTRVTMALGEVKVIIVGDMQRNPAEQSDQMSGALRRGWSVVEGWDHRLNRQVIKFNIHFRGSRDPN